MRSIRFIAPALILFFLLLLSALLVFPERFARFGITEGTPTTSVGEEVSNGSSIGEPIALEGASILIERVLEDSRCPRGVDCVRAGAVRVLATLTDAEEISTGTLELGVPVLLGGYDILLESVSPDPVPGFPIGSYRFSVSGTRATPTENDVSSTTDPRAGPTGVRGLALMTPGCPVERENDQCPPLPASGIELRAVDAGGNEVARTKSGADGRFLILLAPGMYTIEHIDSSLMPAFAPIQASVPETGFQDLLIEADSGIR